MIAHITATAIRVWCSPVVKALNCIDQDVVGLNSDLGGTLPPPLPPPCPPLPPVSGWIWCQIIWMRFHSPVLFPTLLKKESKT